MVDIHKRDLPAGLKEGDVIRSTNGAYVFDELETDESKKRQRRCLIKCGSKDKLLMPKENH